MASGAVAPFIVKIEMMSGEKRTVMSVGRLPTVTWAKLLGWPNEIRISA